jgi:hypothetical protein
MIGELVLQRDATLVRRLRLAPGEAMPWHRDPFQRITVGAEPYEEIAIFFLDHPDTVAQPAEV